MAQVSPLTVMSMVLDSLNEELRKAGTRDSLCEVALVHGDMVVVDYADCGGMAYVRLVSANPTSTFPNPAAAGTCAHDLAFPMEVGIMRQAPGMGEGMREPVVPDADDHLKATSLALEDMEVMRRALRTVEREVEQFVLGSYTPIGPAGGALGGVWSFTAGNETED